MKAVKLKDVCTIKYGKDHKALENGTVPVYGSGGIIRYANKPISVKPSVLIPRKGSLGNLFYIEQPFWTVDTLFWTEIDAKHVLPRYLFYFLKTKDLAGLNIGTAVPSLSIEILNEIELLLPEIQTQKNICKILASFDNKITLNNQINDYLYDYIDTLFGNKVLESVDKSWTAATLLDIANYKNGLAMQNFRPVASDPGLPVIKIKELGQGQCTLDTERCKSNIDEAVHIHDGDLIFSWSGTLKLDFWAGGEAALNQHLFKVTSNKYAPWFYFLWTKCYMQNFVAQAADRATTMGHIKRSALSEAEVFIPPANQMCELDKLFNPIIKQIISLKVESRKLAELRDSLLPKLMSGELDVSAIDVTQLNNHLYDY